MDISRLGPNWAVAIPAHGQILARDFFDSARHPSSDAPKARVWASRTGISASTNVKAGRKLSASVQAKQCCTIPSPQRLQCPPVCIPLVVKVVVRFRTRVGEPPT